MCHGQTSGAVGGGGSCLPPYPVFTCLLLALYGAFPVATPEFEDSRCTGDPFGSGELMKFPEGSRGLFPGFKAAPGLNGDAKEAMQLGAHLTRAEM